MWNGCYFPSTWCVSFGRISVPKLKSNWTISAFALSLNFIPILQVEKLRICKEISVRTEVTAEKLLTLSLPHVLD